VCSLIHGSRHGPMGGRSLVPSLQCLNRIRWGREGRLKVYSSALSLRFTFHHSIIFDMDKLRMGFFRSGFRVRRLAIVLISGMAVGFTSCTRPTCDMTIPGTYVLGLEDGSIAEIHLDPQQGYRGLAKGQSDKEPLSVRGRWSLVSSNSQLMVIELRPFVGVIGPGRTLRFDSAQFSRRRLDAWPGFLLDDLDLFFRRATNPPGLSIPDNAVSGE
jgi:hypothetical protein